MKRLLYSILGNSQKLDGGAMFGNAPKALWERWAAPDDHNRIDLACRALLVREVPKNANPRLILFETGIGAYMTPEQKERFGVSEGSHQLIVSLAERGVSHAQVDVVVLSHLHFDHAGGLLRAWQKKTPSELMFPRARFVVGRAAWERACSPHARDKASFIPDLQVLLMSTGRLELVDGDTSQTLGPDYRFHKSDGHTPGMLLTEIPGKSGPVVFAGDLVPGRPWVHRSITMGYDRNAELLIDEKTALMDDLVARNGRIFFTHDPSCAMARITRDELGRYGSAQNVATVDGLTA